MTKRTPKYRDENVPTVKGLNSKQDDLIAAINNHKVVVATGFAGTGKTFLAATLAAQQYKSGVVDSIILTRPNIPSGPSLGAFPGTMEEKMDPWMKPITRVLKACLGGAYDCGVKNGNIRTEPFETMRGASFSGFVILDEAQNVSPHEMKMFLTRFESGRIVINGDITQSDLKATSGLSVITKMISSGRLSFQHVDFSDPDCIVRSDVCREVIIAFEGFDVEDDHQYRLPGFITR